MVGLQTLRRVLAAIALALLAGCFPYLTTYVHLEAAEGSSVPGACGNRVGPPAFARYDRKGAHFEVTLEPGIAAGKQVGYMAVRASATAAIAIPDPSGYLAPANGDPRVAFRLVPAGSTASPILGTKEQRFEFDGLPPRIDFTGTLHLPDVYVDGQEVIAPVFTFSRKAYAGALPFNC